MDVQAYKAFGDELQKIAAVSLDAATRANMAGRHGKEYLPGGELSSNHPGDTNFVPKIAASDDQQGLKGKFHKGYREARKPAAAAAKGALVGSLLANILTGGRAAGLKYTTSALIGGGAGIADYMAVGKKKTAMTGSGTFTPGRSLAQSRAVGSFQDKVIHKGDRLRPPTMGQRFAIPSDPTQ